jgi:hypothetical protein
VVKVDQTANGSAKLVIGDSSESVDVHASSLQVNTVQATVQGVLTSDQIADLPVNGRNFLDLAQLEPGHTNTDTDPRRLSGTELWHSYFGVWDHKWPLSDRQRATSNHRFAADLPSRLTLQSAGAKSVICGSVPDRLQHCRTELLLRFGYPGGSGIDV